MRIARQLSAVALAVASLTTASSTASAQWSGGVLTAQSSGLMFEFISREATFQHHLGIFEYNGGNPVFLQNIFTAPPDMPGATTTVGGLTLGNQYVLGLYSPNAQACFFFCVNVPTTFYSNGSSTPSEVFGSTNFAFDFGGDGIIGIEDKRDGLFGNADNDYDDMIVSVTTTPEPGTVALLGTGLLGLGGFGLKRRRRNAA